MKVILYRNIPRTSAPHKATAGLQFTSLLATVNILTEQTDKTNVIEGVELNRLQRNRDFVLFSLVKNGFLFYSDPKMK